MISLLATIGLRGGRDNLLCFLLSIFTASVNGKVAPCIFKNTEMAGNLCVSLLLFFAVWKRFPFRVFMHFSNVVFYLLDSRSSIGA